jgi:Rad3-related DNA helicase
MPFPDRRDPLTAARCESDKDWYTYSTLETLVQMAGRVMREPDDVGETLCFDDQFSWLYGYNKHMTPRSFQLAVRSGTMLPPPPPLGVRGRK